jgi:hypothetical protein
MATMPEHQTKPVIFLGFANDRELGGSFLRNLTRELNQVRQALERVKDICEVVFEPNISIERLVQTFRDHKDRIAVFHFAGHANSYQLLLEGANQQKAALNVGGFAQFLAQQCGLGLVVLNGCSTCQQVEALLAAKVPTVTATLANLNRYLSHSYSSLT